MSVQGSNQFWVGTKFDEFKLQTFLFTQFSNQALGDRTLGDSDGFAV